LPVIPFALLALVPAMTLNPVATQARAMEVPLCSGGVLSVPLSGQNAPGGGDAPCCAKGCHTGSSRKRLDKSQ